MVNSPISNTKIVVGTVHSLPFKLQDSLVFSNKSLNTLNQQSPNKGIIKKCNQTYEVPKMQ